MLALSTDDRSVKAGTWPATGERRRATTVDERHVRGQRSGAVGSRCPLGQRGQPNAQPSAVGWARDYPGRLEVKDEGAHGSDGTQVIEMRDATPHGYFPHSAASHDVAEQAVQSGGVVAEEPATGSPAILLGEATTDEGVTVDGGSDDGGVWILHGERSGIVRCDRAGPEMFDQARAATWAP